MGQGKGKWNPLLISALLSYILAPKSTDVDRLGLEMQLYGQELASTSKT